MDVTHPRNSHDGTKNLVKMFDFTTSALTTNEEFTFPLIGIRIGHKLTGMVRCLNGTLAVGDAFRPTQCASTTAQHRPRFRQPRRRARDAGAADSCSGARGLGAPHGKASSAVLGWSSARPELDRAGKEAARAPFLLNILFFVQQNIFCSGFLLKVSFGLAGSCSAKLPFLAQQMFLFSKYFVSC